MAFVKTITCVCFAWLGLAAPLCQGETLAVVVGGLSKDASDRAVQEKTLADLSKCLLAKTKSTRVASTASEIKSAFEEFAAMAQPQDRLVFWYIGQANAAGSKLRLNVAGPDITHEELAAHLARIKAGTAMIVLDCPNAALAVKALSGPGRIIVCASKQEQSYGTQFSQYFIPALSVKENDMDGDGRVSVLEAFAATARQIEQWYRDRQVLQTETPCLDDNGDGTASERPWRLADSADADGAVASKLFLDL